MHSHVRVCPGNIEFLGTELQRIFGDIDDGGHVKHMRHQSESWKLCTSSALRNATRVRRLTCVHMAISPVPMIYGRRSELLIMDYEIQDVRRH
jgi:hypothetical protein